MNQPFDIPFLLALCGRRLLEGLCIALFIMLAFGWLL